MTYRITRMHEICAGHRVLGHENKCAFLHGHAYVFLLTCESTNDQLDKIGRVIDFSVIKTRLCDWLEHNWDHKMLLFEADPLCAVLADHGQAVVKLPTNPTAENLAAMMVEFIAPLQLAGTGVRLVSCTLHETSKCSATYEART